MTQRINFMERGQGAMRALFGLGGYLAKSGKLEKSLIELVNMRVSQINGCAFCLDMHSKDLRAAGETEQRLYLLSAWREAPFYTDKERAALEWAEAVTLLNNREVPDDVYDSARAQFSEEELVDLTIAVTTINTWNRINVAFQTPAGGYQPGMFSAGA